MADDLLNTIVRVLRDRDVPYDRDALKSALSDPNSLPAIQEWVEEFLSPDTLLTKDEATLYATLSRSGEIDDISKQDLSKVQGLNEQEIQTAIEELKRSTAAIEKQSESLKLQQNAMRSLVNNEKRVKQARSQTEKNHIRTWDVEKNQIDASITELNQSLKYQTADLELQLKGSEQSVKQAVDSLLKSDDKLLLSLQKLANDLEPGKPENEDPISNVRELCARLIKHTVEGVRTRLDRIYLETLNKSTDAVNGDGDGQDATDLQEELESLYSEILPVAQMSTEQQYLEPALQSMTANSGHGQIRTKKAIKYIQDCLVFLINRTETFLEHAEESQCHRMGLESVIATAKQELARIDEKPPPPSPARPTTQRPRKTSASSNKGIIPSRRRSSGHGEDEVEPERQLSRSLGITLPAQGEPDSVFIDTMEKSLAERTARLESHAQSLQSTTESSISSYLLDAHVTLALLQDSLLADTMYGKVKLVDPKLEETVNVLEREIEELQTQMEATELHTLQARNVHRDQLVARWSR